MAMFRLLAAIAATLRGLYLPHLVRAPSRSPFTPSLQTLPSLGSQCTSSRLPFLSGRVQCALRNPRVPGTTVTKLTPLGKPVAETPVVPRTRTITWYWPGWTEMKRTAPSLGNTHLRYWLWSYIYLVCSLCMMKTYYEKVSSWVSETVWTCSHRCSGWHPFHPSG